MNDLPRVPGKATSGRLNHVRTSLIGEKCLISSLRQILAGEEDSECGYALGARIFQQKAPANR